MVNLLESLSKCYPHCPTLLELLFSSDIFSTVAFPPMEILIILYSQFVLTLNVDTSFRSNACDNILVDCNGHGDHLRDVP